MHIRPMQPKDYPQVSALWALDNGITDYDYFERITTRNPNTCLLMEDDTGRIVASATGLYDGRRGVLNSVIVLPEERGKGYGKAIVKACVEALQKEGTDRIRLFVLKENEQVVPFYEGLGFELHDHVIYMGL